jgi:L-methionine (R)-S-oxide reductase
MSEELHINRNFPKADLYESFLPQLEALVGGESDRIANLANITAALKEVFGWFWVGFYCVQNNELVLGPFQGTIACTRIKFGKGVCGTAWEQAKSILVPDVNQFPGHIACSSLSVSEIVVPFFDTKGNVLGVIDVDSDQFDILNETDVFYLEKIARIVSNLF